MNWETLLCLGDSITAGSRSYLGFPEYCGEFLRIHTRKNWHIVNESAPGITTIELARRMSAGLPGMRSQSPSMTTVLIGTNDLKRRSSKSEFEVAYRQVVIKAQLMQTDNNVVLIQIPNLRTGVMLPYHFAMNVTVAVYNEVVSGIAHENGLLEFAFDAQDTDFVDGVHLNDTGAQRWGDQLGQFILNMRTGSKHPG